MTSRNIRICVKFRMTSSEKHNKKKWKFSIKIATPISFIIAALSIKVYSINTALFKGYGSCSTVCPSGTMEQLGYSEEQTLEMVNFSLVNL